MRASKPAQSRSRRLLVSRPGVGAVPGGGIEGGRHTDDTGDVVGPRPSLTLLRAAVQEGLEVDRAAEGEGPGPLGTAELVAADADHIGPGGQSGDVVPGDRLDSVGVQHGTGGAPADHTGDVVQRLQRAHLIVDELDRHDADAPVEIGREILQVDDAVISHPDRSHFGHPAARRRLRRSQHGVVLCRGHDNRPGQSACPAQDGQVGRLRAAPGENHVAGGRPEDVSYRVPGLVDRLAGRPGGPVCPRRVAGAARLQPRGHGRKCLGAERRGRGVVQIGRHL